MYYVFGVGGCLRPSPQAFTKHRIRVHNNIHSHRYFTGRAWSSCSRSFFFTLLYYSVTLQYYVEINRRKRDDRSSLLYIPTWGQSRGTVTFHASQIYNFTKRPTHSAVYSVWDVGVPNQNPEWSKCCRLFSLFSAFYYLLFYSITLYSLRALITSCGVGMIFFWKS